jgi:hypothetical protein
MGIIAVHYCVCYAPFRAGGQKSRARRRSYGTGTRTEASLHEAGRGLCLHVAMRQYGHVLATPTPTCGRRNGTARELLTPSSEKESDDAGQWTNPCGHAAWLTAAILSTLLLLIRWYM